MCTVLENCFSSNSGLKMSSTNSIFLFLPIFDLITALRGADKEDLDFRSSVDEEDLDFRVDEEDLDFGADEEDLDFSDDEEEDLDFRDDDVDDEDFHGGGGDEDMDSSLWKFFLGIRMLSLKLDDTSAELLFFFFFFLSISTVS